jgi:hypothetical protein
LRIPLRPLRSKAFTAKCAKVAKNVASELAVEEEFAIAFAA